MRNADMINSFKPSTQISKAKSGYKFQENGLWGLKTQSGETIFDAKYDQIEICTDFIYVHYENRHAYYYYDGYTTDRIDDDDDYRFYKNGKIGLLDKEGNVLLQPVYDEIIDWGNDCDVVYTRVDKEFHYYNHKNEEILTEHEIIHEDAYPLCPYNLGEDQNRNVLLCIEPVNSYEGNNCCYAYNQWVKLSRISRSHIRNIFSSCGIFPMKDIALEKFYDDDTYIYSARYCKSRSETPISECIKKIESLDTYNTSWNYLVKFAVNHNTKISSEELYTAIKHFEDLEACIDYHICIGYDNNLEDGEVSMFQVHYYWDDGGAFLYDPIYQSILPDGSFDEVVDAVKHSDNKEKLLDSAFYWIRYSDKRDWKETEKILNWLYKKGCRNIRELLVNIIAINPFWLNEITNEELQFKKSILKWAIKHRANINYISEGSTLFDRIWEDLEKAKKINNIEDERIIKQVEEFYKFCIENGGKKAVEERKSAEEKIKKMSIQELLTFSKE